MTSRKCSVPLPGVVTRDRHPVVGRGLATKKRHGRPICEESSRFLGTLAVAAEVTMILHPDYIMRGHLMIINGYIKIGIMIKGTSC